MFFDCYFLRSFAYFIYFCNQTNPKQVHMAYKYDIAIIEAIASKIGCTSEKNNQIILFFSH